jgi:hypothetical protein
MRIGFKFKEGGEPELDKSLLFKYRRGQISKLLSE